MNRRDQPGKARRKYDQEFKRQAVEHWLNSNKPGPTVARELGINANLLYRWRDRLVPPPPLAQRGGDRLRGNEALQAENDLLRRANEELRQQRDILKKTLGILSEPPSNGINGLKP